MKKKKIYVYAICKNEEKHVSRWVDSMQEADGIYVLDTGSTDDTVKCLRALGVNVIEKEIKPWRFDVARNESLKFVPKDADICVCTDLDELFEPGWRYKLEKAWKDDTTRAKYNYNWKLDENNQPKVNFYLDKIHSHYGYEWKHPVHEVLSTSEKEVFTVCDDITLNHYPDEKKSRSMYLPLLEMSISEDPLDDRNMHYLGREYMYSGMYQKSIDTLIHHLKLEKAKWKDERAASMRYIARCYTYLGRLEEAKMWLHKAIDEAPYLRDGYIEMALLEDKNKNYREVYRYSLKALDINIRPKTYVNEEFSWDGTIYDLLSVASYYLGYYHEALKYIDIALSYNKNDKRLHENKKIYLKKLSASKI